VHVSFTPIRAAPPGPPRRLRQQDACGDTFIRLQLLGKVLDGRPRDLPSGHTPNYVRVTKGDADPGLRRLSYGGRRTCRTPPWSLDRVAVVSGALKPDSRNSASPNRTARCPEYSRLLNQTATLPISPRLLLRVPCLWEGGTREALAPPREGESFLRRLLKVYKAPLRGSKPRAGGTASRRPRLERQGRLSLAGRSD